MSGSAQDPGFTIQSDPYWPGTTGQTGSALGTGTGQHGQVQTNAFGITSVLQWFTSWLNKPFTTPMNPLEIVVLVGIILISVIFWNLILYHIKLAAETI